MKVQRAIEASRPVYKSRTKVEKERLYVPKVSKKGMSEKDNQIVNRAHTNVEGGRDKRRPV